jgi:predicted ATPase
MLPTNKPNTSKDFRFSNLNRRDSAARISKGVDFYDDGYASEEASSIDNRLAFSKDRFYGRKEELEILNTIYSKVCSMLPEGETSTAATSSSRDEQIPVALIAGYSGTGKSALVNTFAEQLEEKSHAPGGKLGDVKPFFFLSGKYDELQNADPFSAIVQALSGFSSVLLEGDKAVLERIRKNINEAVGSEASALTDVVPDLKQVIDGDKSRSNSCESSHSKDNAWNRLKYVFQTFVKAICTPERPVIMFLDDLQWADSASLDLIAALLTDKSLRHFMFVGATRSNEVHSDHLLTKGMNAIEKTKPIERIDLLNLSIGDIGEFIADALRLVPATCTSLTDAVYSKTRGNIFFTMQTLEELERMDILYFCYIEFFWKWKLEGLDMEAQVSSNVVEAVVSKIQCAPEKLQQALKVAAYTRSSVDMGTLKTLMDCTVTSAFPVEEDELRKILDMAVLEGLLLNHFGSRVYKFAHDKIQQAAYSLVREGEERDTFRAAIGKRLFELASSCQSEGEDWMLFVAVDHLNSTASTQDHANDHSLMARVNLVVGEKASAVAAFVPTSSYLKLGLEALKQIPNHWKSHYDLSLRLYRAMADVELCLGNFNMGNDLGQQVLDHAEKLKDKIPTYISLVTSWGRQERHADALELCRSALELLGERRKRFQLAHMVKDHIGIKKLFKKHSDCDILLLPILKDENMLSVMKLLAEASVRAFHCGKHAQFNNYTFRMLQISFKHGVCGDTAIAFVCYAHLLSGVFGDHSGAVRLAGLACKILETTKAKQVEAGALFGVAYFIDSWSKPHAEVLEIYQRGFKSGMEMGELEKGFRNRMGSIHHSYAAGYPLDSVERAGAELVEQLQQYNVDSILSVTLEIRLPILYLTGKADKPLDWERLEKFEPALNDSSEMFQLLYGYLGRLELGVYFSEFEFAERMSRKLSEVSTQDTSYVTMSFRLFYSGLTASCLARQTGKRKYTSLAQKFAKEMKNTTRTSGRNSHHRYLLMEADIKAARKEKPTKVQTAYDEAISAAVKSGSTQDAALGSELAGEHFLLLGNDELARNYLTQARDLYREWGALAKVKHIEHKRRQYIEGKCRLSSSSTGITVGIWVSSADLTVSRKSVDLGLITKCFTPPTMVPIHVDGGVQSSKDPDTLSCITDPPDRISTYIPSRRNTDAN